MTTVFVDFDSFVVNYDFCSINSITEEEKNIFFESDDFFSKLVVKEEFLRVLEKYKDKLKFVVVANGTEKCLAKKENWVKNNLPNNIYFLGAGNSKLNKKKINMSGCIQIDGCIEHLKTNATIKILFNNNNVSSCQNYYNNIEVLVANTWLEVNDILSFYSLYDYNTLSKKGD